MCLCFSHWLERNGKMLLATISTTAHVCQTTWKCRMTKQRKFFLWDLCRNPFKYDLDMSLTPVSWLYIFRLQKHTMVFWRGMFPLCPKASKIWLPEIESASMKVSSFTFEWLCDADPRCSWQSLCSSFSSSWCRSPACLVRCVSLCLTAWRLSLSNKRLAHLSLVLLLFSC